MNASLNTRVSFIVSPTGSTYCDRINFCGLMGWWEGNINAVLERLYHSNVYKIQWMAAMMPVTAGTFAHEIILLMSKRCSRLGSFLGESCFFECLESKQELCHTYGCLPGRCFLAVTSFPGGKFNLLLTVGVLF